MSSLSPDMSQPPLTTPPSGSWEAMERLNQEAAHLHVWIRTQANQPGQAPWFRAAASNVMGEVARGRVGVGQLKGIAHRWSWTEIGPYLERIASLARSGDVSPLQFKIGRAHV